LPTALYGSQRINSAGLDLADESALLPLQEVLLASASVPWQAQPMLAQDTSAEHKNPFQPVRNPADAHDTVGQVREASSTEVKLALQAASDFAPTWAAAPPAERAAALDRAADAMQTNMPRLMGLLMREAGKTAANAIAEVREAIDFLRYYAAQVRHNFDNATHVPLGPVVCISPWNFPLAIFTGQVAAALAAGNTVLAKPAEQTPLVAAEAVHLLLAAGVPPVALQLLPGRGETVGAPLVADERVQGVMFTGSTEVARLLQRSLAQRIGRSGQPVPLIAETGGQNAMIVDASALPEQVVNDVLVSAFDSAGQRCSALRVLCLQNDVADRVLAMLRGAMAELRVGNPGELAVDVGPVIDAEARDNIQRHIATMRARGYVVFQATPSGVEATQHGTFVSPTLIELPHIGELEREVFGPVLHVVRYARRDLGALIEQINATGYGLTLGVHTRIDETIAQVVASAHAGNRYVNRNMVGAVVGVQPFGGEGLSGTGPKAGGPIYLYRLLAQRPANVLGRALAWGQNAPAAASETPSPRPTATLLALQHWATQQGHSALSATCNQFSRIAWPHASTALAGPTGERNEYSLHPRDAVLCLAAADADRLVQLAAVLAVDSRAIWPAEHAALREQLPQTVRERIDLVADWHTPAAQFDAVLHHGTSDELHQLGVALAQRTGAIVGVQGLAPGQTNVALERLVVERSLSVNTAAAGGNATLMTLD